MPRRRTRNRRVSRKRTRTTSNYRRKSRKTSRTTRLRVNRNRRFRRRNTRTRGLVLTDRIPKTALYKSTRSDFTQVSKHWQNEIYHAHWLLPALFNPDMDRDQEVYIPQYFDQYVSPYRGQGRYACLTKNGFKLRVNYALPYFTETDGTTKVYMSGYFYTFVFPNRGQAIALEQAVEQYINKTVKQETLHDFLRNRPNLKKRKYLTPQGSAGISARTYTFKYFMNFRKYYKQKPTVMGAEYPGNIQGNYFHYDYSADAVNPPTYTPSGESSIIYTPGTPAYNTYDRRPVNPLANQYNFPFVHTIFVPEEEVTGAHISTMTVNYKNTLYCKLSKPNIRDPILSDTPMSFRYTAIDPQDLDEQDPEPDA